MRHAAESTFPVTLGQSTRMLANVTGRGRLVRLIQVDLKTCCPVMSADAGPSARLCTLFFCRISYVIVVTDMDPKPIMENLDAEINGDWETVVNKRNNYPSYFDGQQVQEGHTPYYLISMKASHENLLVRAVFENADRCLYIVVVFPDLRIEEAIEDLKGDLQIKGEEVTTLAEIVRNLEVKIRLTNQKLRVTEQTLNKKEGDHTGKEDKLHQENNSLRERISALSDSIANYKESQEFVKKETT
ncbi:hypothetical protein Tco_1101128 [Tanacetum coccineum]